MTEGSEDDPFSFAGQSKMILVQIAMISIDHFKRIEEETLLVRTKAVAKEARIAIEKACEFVGVDERKRQDGN